MTGPGGDAVEELRLTPDSVEDEEQLAAAVDAFIESDPDARETLAEIANLHGVLHEVIDAHWWPIFHRAEELATARWADLAVGLVRWAFNEGRKHPVVPRGGAT